MGTDLAAKRIEILREVFPRLSRLAVMANADYSERTGRRVNLLPLRHAAGIIGVGHHSQATQARENLAQDFDAFSSKICSQIRQAGNVAAGSPVRQPGRCRSGLRPSETRSGCSMSPALPRSLLRFPLRQ